MVDKIVFLTKEVLDTNLFEKNKYLKNYFVKASSSNNLKLVCNYYNQDGHISFSCPFKKNAYFGVKYVWVPKAQKTSSQVPKVIWERKVNV